MKYKEIQERVSACDITYNVLGQSDRSAMPLGDGELAVSAWVTEDGVLHCYLSRSDALSELDRTIKLGEIQLRFSPVQFTKEAYMQKLRLTKGQIQISGRDGMVKLWVARNTHCLCITGQFCKPVVVSAAYHTWRTAPYEPFGEFQFQHGIQESADVVQQVDGKTLFYHKNSQTFIEEIAKLQNVSDAQALIPNLLQDRIFGGLLDIEQSERTFSIRVLTHSAQQSVEAFCDVLHTRLVHMEPLEESERNTQKTWEAYWDKSYIFVDGDPAAENDYLPSLEPYMQEPIEYSCACTSQITKAYTLTKYMTACCSGGAMPILYSGMLFNLCPGLDEHYTTQTFGRVCTAQPAVHMKNVNPDERSWCREHLWQNVRHPYYSMLERGETEPLRTLFRYYSRFQEINRFRAMRYYHAEGQHNTEMTLSCGLQSPEIYGTNRVNVPDGYAENRWGGAVDISPGLELSGLMLDYYFFTGDQAFLTATLLPYYYDLLRYIETRFPNIESGKMQIGPLNCIETYRDTINPIPIIAGLHSTIQRVLSIRALPERQRLYYLQYQKKLPPIPCNEDTLLPAEAFQEERYNVEVPELYAIYPFRNYTQNKPNLELAKRTYSLRTKEYGIDQPFQIGLTPKAPSYSGWQSTGVVAALLGLEEDAAEILRRNCALQNPGTRFPGMWGPIYDAVPDTDHGANILNQLQKMVMQVEGRTIFICPAFPKKWNVAFKLFVDAETIMEVKCENGNFSDIRQIGLDGKVVDRYIVKNICE